MSKVFSRTNPSPSGRPAAPKGASPDLTTADTRVMSQSDAYFYMARSLVLLFSVDNLPFTIIEERKFLEILSPSARRTGLSSRSSRAAKYCA